MNKNQKSLTWVALGVFVLTLLCAPWEVIDYAAIADAPKISRNEYSTIWSPPANTYGRSELKVSSLFVEWLAIGVLYGGVFALLKRRPT